jgi:uncharacterized protein (DUF983 family)
MEDIKRRSAPVTVWWALSRKCPNCGTGRIFRSYLQAKPACPTCGFLLDRGQDDFFVGAYTINLIVAELAVVLSGGVVLFVSWPDVPWAVLTYALAAFVVILPVLTYPFSRQLWLAVDVIFQPADQSDFADLQEPG